MNKLIFEIPKNQVDMILQLLSGILMFVVGIFVFLVIGATKVDALTINSTYRDMPPSNTNGSNLLALAQNYDSFNNTRFVIFSDTQYSYYIVWGKNLTVSNGIINGTSIEYLRYYQVNTSIGYQYVYGIDTSFRLTSSYQNTSNINGYGFVSLSNNQHRLYYHLSNFQILLCGLLFVVAATSLVKRRY